MLRVPPCCDILPSRNVHEPASSNSPQPDSVLAPWWHRQVRTKPSEQPVEGCASCRTQPPYHLSDGHTAVKLKGLGQNIRKIPVRVEDDHNEHEPCKQIKNSTPDTHQHRVAQQHIAPRMVHTIAQIAGPNTPSTHGAP